MWTAEKIKKARELHRSCKTITSIADYLEEPAAEVTMLLFGAWEPELGPVELLPVVPVPPSKKKPASDLRSVARREIARTAAHRILARINAGTVDLRQIAEALGEEWDQDVARAIIETVAGVGPEPMILELDTILKRPPAMIVAVDTAPRKEVVGDKIEACFNSHPDWTVQQIAEAVGTNRAHVKRAAARRGFQVLPDLEGPKGPSALDQNVAAIHAEHPEFTATEIAESLGVIRQHVTKAAKRCSIVLPTAATSVETGEEPNTPNPTKREELAARIQEELSTSGEDLTASQLAERFDVSRPRIIGAAKDAGIMLRKMSLKEIRIANLQGEFSNPKSTWSKPGAVDLLRTMAAEGKQPEVIAVAVADLVGRFLTERAVKRAAKYHDIELRPAVSKEKKLAEAAKALDETKRSLIDEARSRIGAPEHEPHQMRPLRLGGPRSGVDVAPAKQTVPKGTQVRLREQNGAGLWLHGSCESMTDQRIYAWQGNMTQLAAMRKKFRKANRLVIEPVQKQGPRL